MFKTQAQPPQPQQRGERPNSHEFLKEAIMAEFASTEESLLDKFRVYQSQKKR